MYTTSAILPTALTFPASCRMHAIKIPTKIVLPDCNQDKNFFHYFFYIHLFAEHTCFHVKPK